jgi:hypothetical protein
MCASSFSKSFVWNIFHPKKNRLRNDNNFCIGLHVKNPLFFSSEVNVHCNCLTDFWKILKISNFMKIRQEGAEFFHADGRTSMKK